MIEKRAALLWPLTFGECFILASTNSSQVRDARLFFRISVSWWACLSSLSLKFSQKSSWAGKQKPVTVTLQPQRWNHLRNNNVSATHTNIISGYYKWTIHTLIFSSKMPLQINNIKGEQRILYKYFKKYWNKPDICMCTERGWMVKMWCFFSWITKWNQY